jgi:hypothetical protein
MDVYDNFTMHTVPAPSPAIMVCDIADILYYHSITSSILQYIPTIPIPIITRRHGKYKQGLKNRSGE